MSTYHILRLGARGDGIADGPVFAPRTLPGEEVSGRTEGQVLHDVRIRAPSPDRVRPPCRHYTACGGCQVQHASDGFVAEWKREIVQSALRAQGISAEIGPALTSPPASRRRATLAARRTKSGAMAGFHARASDHIVEVPDCRLLHPDLMAALSVARDLALTGASRKGALAVTASLSLHGLDLAVDGGKPLDGPLRIALAALAGRHDLARLAWEGEVVVTRRAPEQVFGTVRVVPPPRAFLQATAEGEAALCAETETILQGARRIVDLFAGCGTFTFPLARTAAVHAVECAAEMIAALDHGVRHTSGLRAVTSETRDLFRRPLLAEELARFDAAVIDPPRAGAEAQIAELARARVPRIAHVSCNPVTFARDAATLVAAGYALGPVRVVDQFRWSAHVELVAGFTLNGA
ncbi:class I SAM-dependent RNA methyltransferase [Roseovarius autotrophicus]|uniref:class I SAM-dependent RNA methyltransferase n=1 Tax=Roseovarius autotrophicus TaxID=2824121 RepID=UPI001B372AAD